MKNLKSAFIVLIAGVGLFGTEAQAQSHRCTDSSNYAAHANNSDRDGACYATPQSLTLKVHEFGLCKSASSPSDKSDCTALFVSAAGRDMQMASGQSLSLLDQISLEEGTYTHAYLVLNTLVKMETLIDFGSNQRTDLQGRTGRYCFTNGNDYNSTPADIVECSNSLSNLAEASETIGLGILGNTYSNTELGYSISVGGVTVNMDLYMVDSAGNLSTSYNDDFAIFGSQALTSPVNITQATSGLDIAVAVTDMTEVTFSNPLNSSFQIGYNNTQVNCGETTNGCVYDMAWNGLQFVITAQ